MAEGRKVVGARGICSGGKTAKPTGNVSTPRRIISLDVLMDDDDSAERETQIDPDMMFI